MPSASSYGLPVASHENGILLKWVLGIVGTVLAVIFGLLVATVQEQGDEIRALQIFEAETRSNRFTSSDALRMKREIETGPPTTQATRRMNELENRINRLDDRGNE